MMLDEARERDGEGANVFAYTSAISACGKAGQWEKAVSLLDVSRAAETGERWGVCAHVMNGHRVEGPWSLWPEHGHDVIIWARWRLFWTRQIDVGLAFPLPRQTAMRPVKNMSRCVAVQDVLASASPKPQSRDNGKRILAEWCTRSVREPCDHFFVRERTPSNSDVLKGCACAVSLRFLLRCRFISFVASVRTICFSPAYLLQTSKTLIVAALYPSS